MDQLPRSTPIDNLQDRDVVIRTFEYSSGKRHWQARTHTPIVRVFDLENMSIAQLLEENYDEPIKATKRLKRMKTVRAQKARRDTKHRWTLRVAQEYFRITRDFSK